MKRFNFGLEKVLKLRKYHEDETRIELGRAVGILVQIENNIKKNALIRSNAAQQRFGYGNSMETTQGSLQDAFAWENYITFLDRETERLLGEAAKAELLVEEKRETYLEASRQRKVIDKLREKREKENRKEIFSAETRELDDLFRHSISGDFGA